MKLRPKGLPLSCERRRSMFGQHQLLVPFGCCSACWAAFSIGL